MELHTSQQFSTHVGTKPLHVLLSVMYSSVLCGVNVSCSRTHLVGFEPPKLFIWSQRFYCYTNKQIKMLTHKHQTHGIQSLKPMAAFRMSENLSWWSYCLSVHDSMYTQIKPTNVAHIFPTLAVCPQETAGH